MTRKLRRGRLTDIFVRIGQEVACNLRVPTQIEKVKAPLIAISCAAMLMSAGTLYAQVDIERAAADRKPAEAKDDAAVNKRSIALFFDALASDGDWFETDRFGFAWRPKQAALNSDWRPYTDGRWQWTDHGWTWQSQESFGWA